MVSFFRESIALIIAVWRLSLMQVAVNLYHQSCNRICNYELNGLLSESVCSLF